MARNIGLDDGIDVAERIRVEAAELFHHRGYGSTTIRDIAEAVGISSSTMYHHYRNKQDVLFAISRQFMADFNAALLAVLRDGARPPGDRLGDAIRLHLTISNDRRTELLTILGNRVALSPAQLTTIVGMQRSYQGAVRDVVGALHGPDVAPGDSDLVTMALLDLVNGVCQWFDPSGPLSIDEVADRYTRMADSLVAGPSRAR
ncbi:TetR/AcrR family transcriptional regulator [Rhodococcus olei]|uniref:TetR/AcrR family transcriptional regulator n=1 Tax=Rhodococcus olei TaxID=2161675 RepID=A0ABP8P237_9NOCA